jgi:hypothetical protein
MAAALKTLSAMALSFAIRCSADIVASSSMAPSDPSHPELDPAVVSNRRPHGAVTHMMLITILTQLRRPTGTVIRYRKIWTGRIFERH